MAVEFKDYYATLGVPRDASEAEIKQAFRRLARQYHPDLAGNQRHAEEKFKAINEAYEVLGDPGQRRRYDELGARWQEEQPAGADQPRGTGQAQWRAAAPEDHGVHFEGTTGFSDFFEQFFGRDTPGADFGFEEAVPEFGRAGGRAHRPPPRTGADIEGDILVTLDEALHGATREVTVKTTEPATGETTTKTYRAHIPCGVRDGQSIRLAGAGQFGAHGGPPGDLYLRARFARHPDFRVHDADLYHDLDLAPWEAVLGTSITVPTLETRVNLRIPAGTAAGQHFRLRGQGLPTGRGPARGDLYIVARIQTPKALTAEERELWGKLARGSRFNPRETP